MRRLATRRKIRLRRGPTIDGWSISARAFVAGKPSIDAGRRPALIAPNPDYHRAWLIEFPTLADAEAWLDAEVLPPHGRYSDKWYLLARPWAPEYFATWTAPLVKTKGDAK